jgi:hypothetical protein
VKLLFQISWAHFFLSYNNFITTPNHKGWLEGEEKHWRVFNSTNTTSKEQNQSKHQSKTIHMRGAKQQNTETLQHNSSSKEPREQKLRKHRNQAPNSTHNNINSWSNQLDSIAIHTRDMGTWQLAQQTTSKLEIWHAQPILQ